MPERLNALVLEEADLNESGMFVAPASDVADIDIIVFPCGTVTRKMITGRFYRLFDHEPWARRFKRTFTRSNTSDPYNT